MATSNPKRFLDRFKAFAGEEQQLRAVELLHQAIGKLERGAAILPEGAPWAVEFSRKKEKPAAGKVGLLDPSGSEGAGMVGPKAAAPVKTGDSFLLFNGRDEDMEAYDHTGKLLWKVPCLTRGQGTDGDWRHTGFRLGAALLMSRAEHRSAA